MSTHFYDFDQARDLIGCTVAVLRGLIANKSIRTFKFHEQQLLHAGDVRKIASQAQKVQKAIKSKPAKRTVATKNPRTRRVDLRGISMTGPDQPFEPLRMKR